MSIFQRNMVSVIALSTLMAITPVTSVQAQEELIIEEAGEGIEAPKVEETNETVNAIEEASTGKDEKPDLDSNPYIKQLEMQVKVLATELSHEQSADLQKIRTAFGMIESVDMVHSHVSAAVKRPTLDPSSSTSIT